MQKVFRSSKLAWQLLAAIVIGLIVAVGHSFAADAAGRASQNSVKIEPYTGPPIYLPQKEQVAAPTLVTRENVPEKFDDGKIRVERQIARYSDNSVAADGAYHENYPNGKPFIEGQFRNGLQTGDWTYYFDNGQVNRKVTYDDGKLNGGWEVHREDGTLAAKRSFKGGLRDGEWITYDATGKQPLAEEHYSQGQQDGVWKTWFPNGKLKQQVSFKNGKRDGVSAQWDDKGQKLIEAEYSVNKLNGTVTRNLADGKKIVQKYKDGRFVSETKE